MKSIFLTLISCATLASGDDIVPLWSFSNPNKPPHRFYIESERLAKLREIDLLKEKPDLDIATAARVAVDHLKKKYPKVNFTAESVQFYATHVGTEQKAISLYDVTINIPEDSGIADPNVVSVLLDGKVVESLAEDEFEKKFPDAARKMMEIDK